jgi:hypothetical protein
MKIEIVFGTSICKILYLTCMSTCPRNLRFRFFVISEIITFKVEEFFFSPLLERDSSVLEPQKTTFQSSYGMSLLKIVF